MEARLAGLFLAALAVIGCVPGDFVGDDDALRFQTNLTRPLTDSWQPTGASIAVGSVVEVRVVGRVHLDAGEDPAPRATLALGSTAVLEVLDAGVDFLLARAASEGEARLDWTGAVSDTFALRTALAVSAAPSDPLLFRTFAPGSTVPPDAGRWADVGAELVLNPGPPLFLEAVLRGADGGRLAHSPGLVGATATGAGVSAQPVGFGVSVGIEDGDRGT